MAVDDVRRRARAAAVTGSAGAVIIQLLSVGVTIVLARLLSTEDFGQVAAAQTVAAGAALVTSVGLAGALVRQERLEVETADTIFWASLAVGGATAALLVAAAGPLAAALGQPQAAGLVRILAGGLLLQLLSAVPRSLLQRRLLLAVAYRVEVVGVIAYAVVQLGLAKAGFGASSVAVGQVVMAAVTLILMSISARYWPHLRWSRAVLREHARFSGGVLALNGTQYLAKNVDYWAVSRGLGSSQLGLYYVAFVLPNILRQRLTSLVADISWPMLVRHRDDLERLSALHLRNARLIFFLGLPVMVGLSCVAGPVLAVFFGPKWTDGEGALSLLALAAAADLTVAPAMVIFLVLDQPGRAAKLQILRVLVLTGGLLLLFVGPFDPSLTRVAAVVLIATVIYSAVSNLLVLRSLRTHTRRLLEALRPGVLPSALMAAIVQSALHLLPPNMPAWQALSVVVPLGAGVYLAVVLTTRARADMTAVLHLLRKEKSPDAS